MKKSKSKTKNIWNISNLITLSRVIISFIIIYMIFAGFSFKYIITLFIIGMITDALDGFAAKKYNQITEFGRKFDIIADRFLFIGTIVAFMVVNIANSYFTNQDIILMFLLLTREIISFPFALAGIFLKKQIPQTKIFGKATTVLQAVAFPMILLKWEIAVYFAGIAGIVGFFSALTYIRDTKILESGRAK